MKTKNKHNKPSPPMSELEKQVMPMPDEVDPKDAFGKAEFAAMRAAERFKLNKTKKPS